jgi:hypothetical protein
MLEALAERSHGFLKAKPAPCRKNDNELNKQESDKRAGRCENGK